MGKPRIPSLSSRPNAPHVNVNDKLSRPRSRFVRPTIKLFRLDWLIQLAAKSVVRSKHHTTLDLRHDL